MEEEKILTTLGYVMVSASLWAFFIIVMASSYRLGVIKYIGNGVRIPSDIAKQIGVRTNHISNVLSDLKKNGLVICLNENAHKGRLYKNTELALGVLKYLNDMD